MAGSPMDKRSFIKKGITGLIGVSTIPNIVKGSFFKNVSRLKIPQLTYNFNEMGAFASERGLAAHYRLFYQEPAQELEQIIRNHNVSVSTMRQIFRSADKYKPDFLEQAGSYYNHKLFWKTISPSGALLTDHNLISVINNSFGSFKQFQTQFENAALALHGSGWVWLTTSNNQLNIVCTSENRNPLFSNLPSAEQGFPLFGLDMWEHAYYYDHSSEKKNYIKSFWKVLNWDFVSKRYSRITRYRNELLS